MKNAVRKSIKRTIGSSGLVAYTTFEVENGDIKGVLDLSFRNGSCGLCKNTHRAAMAKKHGNVLYA